MKVCPCMYVYTYMYTYIWPCACSDHRTISKCLVFLRIEASWSPKALCCNEFKSVSTVDRPQDIRMFSFTMNSRMSQVLGFLVSWTLRVILFNLVRVGRWAARPPMSTLFGRPFSTSCRTLQRKSLLRKVCYNQIALIRFYLNVTIQISFVDSTLIHLRMANQGI